MTVGLWWLRRDLRLSDNPALHTALRNCKRVVPVYIYAPEEEGDWAPGAASRWWLHHSLAALARDLRQRGSRLLLRRGSSARALAELAAQTGADRVYCNRLYEPAAMARDAVVERSLGERGIAVHSFNAALLHEPWAVRKPDRSPYRVFTSYWKACQKVGFDVSLQPTSQALPAVADELASAGLQELDLLPQQPWDGGLRANWRPGEDGAHRRLQTFLDQAVAAYAQRRDRPDATGTSRLSPHLHFGEIGPRQIWHALQQERDAAAVQAYVRQLGWREFAQQLLYHFPHTAEHPLDPRFEHMPWSGEAQGALRLWQQGETGIPLVDAGMRELWHTGWMHNRVRMVSASLLTKNLLLPWRHGARWFWDTLVDADLANNTLGWQWTAGCGADAAPYFRVFNPVLQGERFDPEGRYVCTWIPQLARLPDRYRHRPWQAPQQVLEQSGLRLGRDYPAPMVDLSASRERALAAYRQMRTQGGA